MVAIQILNQVNDALLKGIDDEVDLVVVREILNHLLQGASAVLVESDANHVLGRILDKDSALVIVAVLKELLAQVVAEGISHEFDDMRTSLKPDLLDLLWVAILQLLLKVTATVLILAQLVDPTSKGLQGLVVVRGHACEIVSMSLDVKEV